MVMHAMTKYTWIWKCLTLKWVCLFYFSMSFLKHLHTTLKIYLKFWCMIFQYVLLLWRARILKQSCFYTWKLFVNTFLWQVCKKQREINLLFRLDFYSTLTTRPSNTVVLAAGTPELTLSVGSNLGQFWFPFCHERLLCTLNAPSSPWGWEQWSSRTHCQAGMSSWGASVCTVLAADPLGLRKVKPASKL